VKANNPSFASVYFRAVGSTPILYTCNIKRQKMQ